MDDDLSDKDKALWQAAMGEEKPKEQEENFADLLDQNLDQKPEKVSEQNSPQPQKTKAKTNHNEPLDKTIERKLKQGKIEPDARIDLHGMTQQQAHAQLNRFIDDAYHRGRHIVLAITGKGKSLSGAEDWITPGQGVLKQKLPEWVKTGDLKEMVIDAIPSHAKHGGTGAYYIILKKKK